MATMFGRFEIQSELSKSDTALIYKAMDTEANQVVALKTQSLEPLGERADAFVDTLIAEGEATRNLAGQNIVLLYGAGEMDGQFCAAMEYIQGNSVATMLARKEGFSIWDLLDIGRQVCSGLDHAHSHKVFHYSLEPAKIMCGWDGTVRILGFGVSTVGKFTAQMPDVPSILHYMSPEQVRGENIDARSNIFSLGTLFYEMVTDRKAFDREDSESVRQSILESTPVPPMHVNPKLHPLLSDLIMKAIAKDPGERYQNGRELLDDLEKCKESNPQAAKAAVAAPKVPAVAAPVKAATPQAKAVSAPSKPVEKKPAAAQTAVAPRPATPPAVAKREPAAKAAPAAGGGGGGEAAPEPQFQAPNPPSASPAKANGDASTFAASMSSAVVEEPEVEAPSFEAPKITVDPMMAGAAPAGSKGISFSEMTELPPLKEIYIAPPPPPAPTQQDSVFPPTVHAESEPEKLKIQPREVAEKAIREIKNVPPSLMVYSIAGAAVLILIIAIGLFLHINHLNSDDDASRPAAEPATQAAASQPAAAAPPVQAQPQPSPEPVQVEAAPTVVESQPAPTRVASTAARGKAGRKKSAAPAAPVVVPGLMAIDSTPQGAQVQLDGKTDPSWVTPLTLSGLSPGQHSVTVSKAGYSTDTRSVEVGSGSKAFVVGHLTQLMATLSVSSTPAGANVYIDGRDTGKVTPAQVSVDKGQHLVLVRKSGYIDETTSAQFVLAQAVSFSPTLRSLGNVDDIRTVGKMKKLFGGKEAQGMATVSIKTQPKGAQVAVNQHMLEKSSPVDVMLDPGNYIVDITLSGYAPIHKVVTVDKGGKAVIDEVMQHD